ncbi:MAG TPA: hypothetical protein VFG10_02995 [Saprospiraceae bacterium]|nr:hypothetical protein [Saprospiraceae bacterium]
MTDRISQNVVSAPLNMQYNSNVELEKLTVLLKYEKWARTPLSSILLSNIEKT